jgi:phenylalanyl-tRNA synthetase alpha chain
MSGINDISPPELIKDRGSIHPINHMKDSIMNLLVSFGFEIVDGPEIESEEFNFDMLNIKKSHPARQMHDTFYVEKKPPLAFISGGKVYRKDDDATHLPMFHQVEGIYVDENVSFSQLKDLIYKIIYSLFGEEVELRFRPSYFPFTEPSAEVDILSKEGKWLEILGCGLVNPVVLENCNINSNNYSGLAFGLGIERIAMLKHGVTDIREFYKSNLDFLSQFK